ncbi:hypothetical protein LPL9_1685 [Lacticaseibacillus paracasei]|nr:hypothetical protein LPL9_1685 [Lacticaseibacillus paracasei]
MRRKTTHHHLHLTVIETNLRKKRITPSFSPADRQSPQ